MERLRVMVMGDVFLGLSVERGMAMMLSLSDAERRVTRFIMHSVPVMEVILLCHLPTLN